MTTRDEILKVLKEIKPLLSDKYKVSKIGLFGSYSRDEADADSDIDILVEIEPKFSYLIEVENLLENRLHHKVDIVRLHKNLRERFKNKILQEVIYA